MSQIHIPYPGVELLLKKHGNTAAGRRAARSKLEAHLRDGAKMLLDKAIQESARSMRCGRGDHHRLHDGYWIGCANDGSTCICECHDSNVARKEAV